MPATVSTPAQSGLKRVHILSDSTGNLPRHMMTAFATQFPANTFSIMSKPFIHGKDQLDAMLRDVKKSPGIVLHAFVSPDLKRATTVFCQKAKLPCRDLTGEFVEFLSEHTGVQPICNPQRLHEMDDNYFRRIKGLEFALQHDDGLGLETLHDAEIVLTGISRTGKTPTTIHLGQQGVLAANVVLVQGLEPPRELLQLPPETVIGLTIEPHRLAEIRTHRQADLGTNIKSYCDWEKVEEEVRWSRDLIRRQRWHLLDVTYQAIEEVAARAIEAVKSSSRGSPPPSRRGIKA